MKKVLLILLGFITLTVSAQDSTLNIKGFVDAYYAYDFDEPNTNERPSYLYNHTRHNELSINLALIQLNYEADKTRGSIGLMAGTYAQYNLAHEQPLMRHVFEAYGGVRLGDGLWLDAGIFGSHLGFESAISTDNITLTRSLMAENSPYYLSGSKLTYGGIEKWTFQVVVSNGWQNISDNNNNKAIGTQIVYEPSDNLLINYSTMTSNELDSASTRFFNDFYIIASPTKKIKVILALDYGIQDKSTWYAPAFLLGYDVNDKISVGYRIEKYVDKDGVIIMQDFNVLGNSINVDYKPNDKAKLRVEFKNYTASTPIFDGDKTNESITVSLGVNFGK